MITKFIIILVATSFIIFFAGVSYADKKHRQDLIQHYEDTEKLNTAWQKHCNAMREQYQNALIEERKKHKKCTCDEKVLYQGKYEIDPCVYVEKQRFENVTVSIRECKKCGHVDIAWERQEDTEEVEVE